MKRHAMRILVFTVGLFIATFGTAWAKDIVVLSQFPMSGPLGALPELGWGYIDAMTWFNEEAGGVRGKEVKWHLEDMRYSPKVEVANFTRFCAQYGRDEFVMASGFITDGIKALIQKVNVEEKIPWVDGSFSCEMFGPKGGPSVYPYYYSVGAHYCDQIKILVKWIKDNHKGSGAPRLAFVNSPTAYGRDGLPQGLSYAKAKGVEVVAKIEYPYSATDATTECMTLRRCNAQYVIYHGYTGTQTATALFFKTAHKIIPDVQLMGTAYMGGRFPILLMGEAYDGFIGAYCAPFFDAVPRSATPMENAMVKLVHDFARKYRPDGYEKGLKGGGIKDMSLYEIGMMYAFIIQEALLEADKRGDISRAGIKKAMDHMVWDFKGMFGGKRFSYKSHTIPMLRLYQAKVKMVEMGGKEIPTGLQVPVSEWVNTNQLTW
jgi:ABC-type branched-subunit amino acid transport system substrate-binding protein